MRYLYTNTPDEGCHEVEPGVFGRPFHTGQIQKHLKAGWKNSPKDVEAKKEEVPADLIAAYEAKFGQKPHHKMKADTIAKALANDLKRTGKPYPNAAGC